MSLSQFKQFLASLRVQEAEQKAVQIVEGLLWTAAVAGVTAAAHVILGGGLVSWTDVLKAAGVAFVLALGNALIQLGRVSPPAVEPPTPASVSSPNQKA